MADSFPAVEGFRISFHSDGKILTLRGYYPGRVKFWGQARIPLGPLDLNYNPRMWQGGDSRFQEKLRRIYGSIGRCHDTIKGWQDLAFKNKDFQTISEKPEWTLSSQLAERQDSSQC
ncbi:hypothetical protein CEK25_008067 [Fusarium fujikuroi]|nr:hypothetical protein CEK25_008067 [Fusarium fujikuroi]